MRDFTEILEELTVRSDARESFIHFMTTEIAITVDGIEIFRGSESDAGDSLLAQIRKLK